MMDDDGPVDVLCGRRIFKTSTLLLKKDPTSRLCELCQTSEPRAVRIDPFCLAFIGPVLRFYETGSVSSFPSNPEDNMSLMRVLDYLKVNQLKKALGILVIDDEIKPVADLVEKDVVKCDDDDGQQNQTLDEIMPAANLVENDVVECDDVAIDEDEQIFLALLAKVEGTEDHVTKKDTREGEAELDDEELIFLKLMDKINKRKEDPLADLNHSISQMAKKMESLENDATMSLRTQETCKVEFQRLLYERDQMSLQMRNKGKNLAYNLLVVGVTGSGKSSSINSITNQNLCRVSGAQAQGTRGCHLQDGVIADDLFVSFIDTQGLGADTSVTDEDLLSQIMMSTETITKLKVINNILISFDTNTRATPATMANQLTLIELFRDLRNSCFLILTKWNSNSVMVEWNLPLRRWTKKYRRARTVEEITEDPPSYHTMYKSYCDYIMQAMNNDEDAGAFSKMGTFLSFFGSKILFIYNLDAVQIEDLECGELEPHIVRLYEYYRQQALNCLKMGSTNIPVDDLTFLKEDTDTLASVAKRLIEARDSKIKFLENIGLDAVKRFEMGTLFTEMAKENKEQMEKLSYDVPQNNHMEKIADLAGFTETPDNIGCLIQ